MKSRTINKLLGFSFSIIGLILCFLPLTYYGYLDYVIYNSVVMLNLDSITLELKDAAIQLFNGHPILKVSNTYLITLAFLGVIFIFIGVLAFIGKLSYLKEILTKKYWTEFKLTP